MIKLRLIFLIFLILLLLPILRYYELSKDRDRFISYSINQSTVTEINFLPRGKIVDRNDNQLALDIVRPTLLFNNQTQKEMVFKLAEAEGIPVFSKF
jgi:Cell division protein FtsI/penicillin-binding protein 2